MKPAPTPPIAALIPIAVAVSLIKLERPPKAQ